MAENNRRRQDNNLLWTAAVVGTAGLAALAASVYHLTRKSESRSSTKPNTSENRNSRRSSNDGNSGSMFSHIIDFFQKMESPQCATAMERAPHAPVRPTINNLNALLSDIYTRFVAIDDENRLQHHKVFTELFNRLHEAMKEVDPYYRKYCGNKQFAGSHSDGLRINKANGFPDEDIDIVIGLPLNFAQNPFKPEESDIVIEAKYPGFVQLKMGVHFQRLLMRDGSEWLTNKTAYSWKDEKNYLLCSKFIFWFKSVVAKALNKLCPYSRGTRYMNINGVQYRVHMSDGAYSPAVTLKIENESTGFKLDVDLVPALRFPENRWPISKMYRSIPSGCSSGYWMTVPKRNKAAQVSCDESRCWRVALHEQEKRLMHGTNNMRQALRLMKKFRDAQGMNEIASYYIKTLFFDEIIRQNDLSFWSKNNPSIIFQIMAKNLYLALTKGEILYFWNKSNNLIASVDRGMLNFYARKVKKLLDAMEDKNNYKMVAGHFLTSSEYENYMKRLQ